MDFNVMNQVVKIEYVGPHQIQTTSSSSMNFTGRIERDDAPLECIRHGKARLILMTEKPRRNL